MRADDALFDLCSAFSPDGFDLVILSDLIWIDTSHQDLVDDIARTLSHKPSSRSFILTGRYCKQQSIDSFTAMLAQAGLAMMELDLEAAGPSWRGSTEIEGLPLDPEQTIESIMLRRRRAVRAFEARWR